MAWVTAGLPLSPAVKAEEVTEAVRRFYGPSIDGLEQPIEILAGDGLAAPEIVELLEEMPADLLVLGSRDEAASSVCSLDR